MLIDEDNARLTLRLKKTQEEDPETLKTLKLAEQDQARGYITRSGLLFREVDDDPRLVVPKGMHSQIIKQTHGRGHFSVGKTEALVRKEYWIQNLQARVVRNCVDCILAERKQGRQEEYLNPINKGEVPLDTFHIDHLGPLATKKSYRHIFIVIDSFTKFTWLYATKSTTTAEVLDSNFWTVTFGNPRRIISDRGTAFTSKDFQDYCKHENIQHILTTTGIPRKRSSGTSQSYTYSTACEVVIPEA